MAKILYVGSDAEVIMNVREILEGAGYETVTANGGLEGLEKIGTEKPDLVIVEFMMLGMSGWDLYERVRKTDTETKIAFLSNIDCSEERRNQFIGYGLSDYILKPFIPSELGDVLVAKVKEILGNEIVEKETVGTE